MCGLISACDRENINLKSDKISSFFTKKLPSSGAKKMFFPAINRNVEITKEGGSQGWYLFLRVLLDFIIII